MTVYVLIREAQNDHGYVDTCIAGVFRDEHVARELERHERQSAREDGLIVEEDGRPNPEWQVSWVIEEHVVS